MCDSSGRLVAWMDRELAENEAAVVEQHVRACEQCQKLVAAYEEVSRGFAAHYTAATRSVISAETSRKWPRFVPVLAAAAAAGLLLLALLPRTVKPSPVVPQVMEVRPPITSEPQSTPVEPVRGRHVVAHRKAPNQDREMAGPAIQIAIPADSMFPPGAVPEGVSYIANLSLTDGSVQAIRLQR